MDYGWTNHDLVLEVIDGISKFLSRWDTFGDYHSLFEEKHTTLLALEWQGGPTLRNVQSPLKIMKKIRIKTYF
jgi:hypothetical protein